MMKNETIILLTYFYDSKLSNHRLLKYIKRYLGAYLPFDLYLYEPLQRIFSKVILYDYLERMTEIGIIAVNEEIIALVRKEHPKYVLWTSWHYDILESTLEAIRKEGSIVIGWFFDDDWRFDYYSKWWIPYLDFCVTNDIQAVPKYKEFGAKVIQTIPNTGIAFDHDWNNNILEKYDVSFVGTIQYADREKYIETLNQEKIPIHLFGSGSGAGYVSFEEMIDIFKTSKINLNFSKEHRHFKPQIKGRIFQICLAGGFVLTEYVPGIENYFEIDKEIVCFHDVREMFNKINYYLNHGAERRKIVKAGWKKAIHEYTSFHMVSKVFSEIEGDLPAKYKKSISQSCLQKSKMSLRVRWIRSIYHFHWARTLIEENCEKTLWKDELMLAISYNPFSIEAWYYYIISFMPSLLRPILFMVFGTIEEFLFFRFKLPFFRGLG